MALTNKQHRFVDEYMIDLNATQAAIRSGYSKKTARQIGEQNLSKIDIQAVLTERMKAREQRTEVTQDYVLNTIVETVERCKQARQVFDKAGNPVMVETADGEIAPAFVFDSGAVLKGAELLGKHLKMFTDKTELTGKDGEPLASGTFVLPAVVTPEEWKKKAAEHQAQLTKT